jgi:hypothetical protein
MSDPLCLVLTTFPQRWDGSGRLTLNVVLLPTADPLPGPLIGTTSPSFASGTPKFTVFIDPGTGALPDPAGPNVISLTPTVISQPATPAATFNILQSAVTANKATLVAPAPPPTILIRKALPPSYLAAGGNPPDGKYTASDDEFGCAIRGAAPTPVPSSPIKTVTWGQVISYALRQPVLAMKLGLVYQLSVTLPAANAEVFADGAFVFAALAATDPWAVAAASKAGSIRTHAARIPPLNKTARALFASIEFPTKGSGGTPDDTSLGIAEVYSDGFAKMVHCAQPDNSAAAVGDGQLPPGSDLGIEIGWDDEQVVNWQNDQLALLQARSTGLDAATQMPLGVQGYRVDVADVTPATTNGPFKTPAWQSLCAVTTTLPSSLGTFVGDLCVEPVPVQPYSASSANLYAWLPRYFALWKGGSLCEPDPVPNALTNPKNPPITPLRRAVGLTTLLSYGHTYSFRVRLGDLSNGGPVLSDSPINPGPAATASQTFQRLVAPKAPLVKQLDATNKPITTQPGVPSSPAALVVSRPLITYPEVLYTHLGDQAAWRDTIRTTLVANAVANANAKGHSIAGLPDPDVAQVSIEVLVRHPLNDAGTSDGPYVRLYTTSRVLNATSGPAPLSTDPGTTIPVVFVDEPDIVNWSTTQPTNGPLLIPRGRDVQVTLRGVLRTDEPSYFAPTIAQGMATTIFTRVEPVSEPELLGQPDSGEPITGYLFRRPPDVSAPGLVDQLAQQLGVTADGNSLCTPPGRRVVYGASRTLRTLISADGETLTFGSTSDLLRYWIVAIELDLERDWTWDGLGAAGFTVLRGGPTATESSATAVGSITIPRVLGASATAQPSTLERSRTHLIFLDAIDPHEATESGFPESLQNRWFVKPDRTPAGPALPASPPVPVYASPQAPLTGTDYADAPLDLRLPIAIPPTQVPAIASVGLALSPYQIGELYASTATRQRSLWIELSEAIVNSAGDALFARVLAHGADPILYEASPAAIPNTNPPLPLDPELVRAITPGESDNRDGLTAMTQLTPAPGSSTHFLLPLPPGVSPDDPELFGFYTYELRVGHAGTPDDLTWWSTANGRFGSPLRVVGVQHPAPPLACHVGRVNIPTADSAATLSAITTGNPFNVQNVLAPLAGPVTPSGTGTPSIVVATAPYATPVLDGEVLYSLRQPAPKTTMWFLVYVQAVQADGASVRNILIAAEPGVYLARQDDTIGAALKTYLAAITAATGQDRLAVAVFHQAQIEAILASVHLPSNLPLSMIAVEFLPGGTGDEVGTAPTPPLSPVHIETKLATPAAAASAATVPSGKGTVLMDTAPPPEAPVVDFPFGRILRVSPLTPIAPFC